MGAEAALTLRPPAPLFLAPPAPERAGTCTCHLKPLPLICLDKDGVGDVACEPGHKCGPQPGAQDWQSGDARETDNKRGALARPSTEPEAPQDTSTLGLITLKQVGVRDRFPWSGNSSPRGTSHRSLEQNTAGGEGTEAQWPAHPGWPASATPFQGLGTLHWPGNILCPTLGPPTEKPGCEAGWARSEACGQR